MAKQNEIRYYIERLKSKDYFVFYDAVHKLGELRSHKAVPHLIEILKSDKSIERFKVLEALGKIGSIKALFPMIDQLTDGKAYVRSYAVRALGQIRAKLLEQTENPAPKQPIAFALFHINPAHYPKAFLKFYEEVKSKPNKPLDYWKLTAKQLTAVEGKLK
ncbi:HEAT repeat domain-containing protein [Candidatus Micrarchaeota archaeon]|nr:HEAT repeat domain-containing protein [Candidatus Micrarchaeota archaeon]